MFQQYNSIIDVAIRNCDNNNHVFVRITKPFGDYSKGDRILLSAYNAYVAVSQGAARYSK